MISIKNEQEIELMRISGQITYGALSGLKNFIKPGITSKDIDKYCYDYITSHDAVPSFLCYEGFPATACISINDVVVHGIPDDTVIKDGDIVLMHDSNGHTSTVNALRDIIRYGKNNGYTFKAITSDTPIVRHGVNN